MAWPTGATAAIPAPTPISPPKTPACRKPIRDSDDEHFDEVARVLDGTSDKVISLTLEPGDLQPFKGRYSLHRVAPLRGPTPRYVAIFSYVLEQGMVGSVERKRQLCGPCRSTTRAPGSGPTP